MIFRIFHFIQSGEILNECPHYSEWDVNYLLDEPIKTGRLSRCIEYKSKWLQICCYTDSRILEKTQKLHYRISRSVCLRSENVHRNKRRHLCSAILAFVQIVLVSTASDKEEWGEIKVPLNLVGRRHINQRDTLRRSLRKDTTPNRATASTHKYGQTAHQQSDDHETEYYHSIIWQGWDVVRVEQLEKCANFAGSDASKRFAVMCDVRCKFWYV